MLVLAVGPREAARRMGLSESTVMQWSARGNWLAGAKDRQSLATGLQTPAMTVLAETLPVSMRPVVVSGVSKPADSLRDVIADRGKSSKLSLSRYVQRGAARLATLPASQLLTEAANAKAIAGVASQVWPEKTGGTVNLSIYGGQQVIQAGDITSDE